MLIYINLSRSAFGYLDNCSSHRYELSTNNLQYDYYLWQNFYKVLLNTEYPWGNSSMNWDVASPNLHLPLQSFQTYNRHIKYYKVEEKKPLYCGISATCSSSGTLLCHFRESLDLKWVERILSVILTILQSWTILDCLVHQLFASLRFLLWRAGQFLGWNLHCGYAESELYNSGLSSKYPARLR